MGDSITRKVVRAETVDIPDGHIRCEYCKGAGMLSKYDEGHRSLVHSPELAALRQCIVCGGRGYVPEGTK